MDLPTRGLPQADFWVTAALPLDHAGGRIEAFQDVEVHDPGWVEVLGVDPTYGTLLRFRMDPALDPDAPDGLVFFVHDIESWPAADAAQRRLEVRGERCRVARTILDSLGS